MSILETAQTFERMLQFYDLVEAPFNITPDPRFLYHTTAHLAAFSRCRTNLVQLQGLSLVVGDAGSGKSTIARRLLEELQAPQLASVYEAVLVKNASTWTTPTKMIRALSNEFALPLRRSEDAQWSEFEGYVSKRAVDDSVNIVILIDEAQSLPRKVLARMREVLNFEANHRKFVQLILFGTLDMWDLLQDPALRPLRSRIAGGPAFLRPLELDDLRAAIMFRLRVAGRAEPLFEEECFPIIHAGSEGNLRTAIDCCRAALDIGYREGESEISGVTVEIAVEETVPGFRAAAAASEVANG